jgi:signal transduction histidine kinase
VEQFIGKNTGDPPGLIDKDERNRMVPLDEDVLTSGEPREVDEYEVQLPSGERRFRRMEKYPLFDENGRAISVISWSEDITGRKEAEERMKLQQTQLIHADKMASLGVLVAGVAHEINNPNTAIMLNVPLLGQMWEAALPALEIYHGEHPDFTIANLPFEQARKEIPKLLSGIIRGSNRVNHIVNNLKNFGRMNEEQAAALININDVVELAISLLKSHINQFTDEFSVEYGDDIPQFKGHFHEIEQVVINLVNNACQALADRKQKVRVSTGFNPKGQVIQVEVRDEGSGIPEDILHKIMDPFFTTRAEAGGTGLGLSVSFGILQEHGGGLRFDSKVGVGTSATVTLPSA